MVDEAFLTKCLEFSRCLSETERFSFHIKISTGFTFNFSNRVSGKPEVTLKKKKTPSQMKRNTERLKNFIEKKRTEASGKPEDSISAVEYTLKMDAHAACTTADIVEVIKVNFVEDLDSEKVEKDDPVRNVEISRLEEKQGIRKIEGQYRNLQVFRIAFKQDQVAVKVVESWKEPNKFDDQAFVKSTSGDIRIQIREIERIR